MNQAIREFIDAQTCASFSCVDGKGNPYAFTCFYAFDAEKGLLIFKSNNDTHHAALIRQQPLMAGTILPDKLNKLMVQGIQLTGIMLDHADPLASHAASFYYRKNPMAMAMPGEIWTFQLHWIKYTDSKLGFGKN